LKLPDFESKFADDDSLEIWEEHVLEWFVIYTQQVDLAQTTIPITVPLDCTRV
jgi:hypothetical protein